MNAKVTLIDSSSTPPAAAAALKGAEVKVKDARGRQITLKKPSVLAQYRIVEVAGASAENEVYMSMVLPIVFVTSIDEEFVLQPTSKLQLEALIQRLDEDGIAAVMQGVREHFSAPAAPNESAAP
jgi:hypothetical protein